MAVLELVGHVQERPEQGSAVIVHQFDQSSFLHQPAEFDQMSGACAPVLDPLALVVAGSGEVHPVALDGQAPELGCRGLQVP